MSTATIERVERSLEQPEFTLVEHDSPSHSEDDIYGVSHKLVYTSGSADEVQSFHMAHVLYHVFDRRNYGRGESVLTNVTAQQYFPLWRQSEIRCQMRTAELFTDDELEVIAGGFIQMLAAREHEQPHAEDKRA